MIEKLYIKQRIFSDEMIQEIRSEGDPIMLSGIHRNGKSLLDDKTRSSTHIKMPPEEWPDIVHPMFELMCQFDPSVNPQQFRCSENLEYLKYDVNGKFTKHKDVITQKDSKDGIKRPERYFSTTTLLGATDDLDGGDFNIWTRAGEMVTVPMEVGETIMFRSDLDHEVTNINKGIRRSLVVWIHKI